MLRVFPLFQCWKRGNVCNGLSRNGGQSGVAGLAAAVACWDQGVLKSLPSYPGLRLEQQGRDGPIRRYGKESTKAQADLSFSQPFSYPRNPDAGRSMPSVNSPPLLCPMKGYSL